MSGVASNGDAAGQAREYNYIRTDEIGDDYGGERYKWSGGALAADGCIYCAPQSANRILRINPKTSTTALVGKSLGYGGGKCSGAAASKDGRFVYCIPDGRSRYRNRVLKFKIDSQNWVEIGDKLGTGEWSDPVLAHDNCIYAAPHNDNTILKINPSNDSVELLPVDGLEGGYETSVLSEDKKEIFFIPSSAKQILRFDTTETKDSQFVGDEYEGDDKWSGGVLHDDGFVYAMPQNQNKILKFNPSDNTTELVDCDIDGNNEGRKFSGCFKGSDGCIYGIPCNSNHVLLFDPTTTKCSFVGKRYDGNWKWHGCAQAKDANIFAVPCDYGRVLKISLTESRSNNSAAVCGTNNKADLLSWVDTPKLGDFNKPQQVKNLLIQPAASSSGNAAGQVSMYNSIRTAEIGDDYGDECTAKWSGGVIAANGCIYCAPLDHDRILKVDPKTSTTKLVGKSLGDNGGYSGAAASESKKIVYFVPNGIARVLKFDTGSQNWKVIGCNYGDGGWCDPVLAADNCIYAAPTKSDMILKIDPSNDSVDVLVVDGMGYTLHLQYETSVLSKDKKEIFFIPFNAARILRFNTETKQGRLVGDEYEGDDKWSGGVLHYDGCVYAMPQNHNKILKYNPSDNTTELVGCDFKGEHKWSGCFKGNDGCIYGIPDTSNHILRFDPNTTSCSLAGKKYKGTSKWYKCVQAEDGSIFAVPHRHNKVLKISLTESRSNHSIAVRGINDTINTPDLLGYDLYAKVIAKHAQSLQGINEPLCVGLLAPWGTGKSFFWQLIKKELKKFDSKIGRKDKAYSAPGIALQSFNGVLYAIDTISCWDHFCLRATLLVMCSPLWLAVWIILVSFLTVRLAMRLTLKSIKFEVKHLGDIIFDNNSGEDHISNKFRPASRACKNAIEEKEDIEQGLVHDAEYIFVEFGAWSYRGTDNLWASLMEEMWAAVESKLGEDDVNWHRAGCKKADEKPYKYQDEKEATEMMQCQYQIWKSLSYVAIVALAVAVVVVSVTAASSMQTNAPSSYISDENVTAAAPSESFPALLPDENVTALASIRSAQSIDDTLLRDWLLSIFIPLIVASIGEIKASKVKKYVKSGFEVIDEQLKKHDPKTFLDKFKRKDFSTRKGFMGEVQDEIRFLVKYLKDRDARLVIFVDDLDRCDQDTTMQILWAVKLLLCEGPISCWLAIDTKIVVNYIEADFKTGISGFRYLEKIINLPFSIPAMDDDSKTPFLEGVVDGSELNVVQTYAKLRSLKLSSGYGVFSSMNEDMDTEDKKLKELVKLGAKINDFNVNFFGDQELNLMELRDAKVKQRFLSKLLQVSRTNHITEYKKIYDLMTEEEWIGDALKFSKCLLPSSSDDFRLAHLPSPKVHDDFQTLKDESELAHNLCIFFAEIGVPIEPTMMGGYELARLSNIIYRQLYDSVQHVQGRQGDERSKQFREDFLERIASPVEQPLLTDSLIEMPSEEQPPTDETTGKELLLPTDEVSWIGLQVPFMELSQASELNCESELGLFNSNSRDTLDDVQTQSTPTSDLLKGAEELADTMADASTPPPTNNDEEEVDMSNSTTLSDPTIDLGEGTTSTLPAVSLQHDDVKSVGALSSVSSEHEYKSCVSEHSFHDVISSTSKKDKMPVDEIVMEALNHSKNSNILSLSSSAPNAIHHPASSPLGEENSPSIVPSASEGQEAWDAFKPSESSKEEPQNHAVFGDEEWSRSSSIYEQPSHLSTGSIFDPPEADSSSSSLPPVTLKEQDPSITQFGYENLSMVDSRERVFLLEYARFLSDVPRKIKRVVNVYVVTKQIAAECVRPESTSHLLWEKLFILTVLQESFPYRTSWLVFMAMCAVTEEYVHRNSDRQTFHSLLKELVAEDETQTDEKQKHVGELPLLHVYDRLVCGMLRCLPNSEKLLQADTHTQHFASLLRGLKLKDLFCDQSVGGLQKFLFNMPQGMLNDVKKYDDHCFPVKYRENKRYWSARPKKTYD